MAKKSDMKYHRFIGISLAGGKTKKTCLAIVDYFPEHEKVFLNGLFEKIGEEGGVSSDDFLLKLIDENADKKSTLAVDVPLSMPKCITCRLKCPGVDSCKVKEVAWMRAQHKKRAKVKRPNKVFTPYTERCVEIFLQDGLEEAFHQSHALGANAAPLTARAHFLKKRIKHEMIEVAPKVSIWRIGRDLKVAKSHLRFHKHSVSGEESRAVFMDAMNEKKKVFIYQQDLKLLIQSHHSFEAFISALTAYLNFRGECEKPPKGFPGTAAWIRYPKKSLDW